MPLVQTAREVATRAHGDQHYGAHPYHVHLDAVAELAGEFGETARVVAYLHDVVEDTPVELAELESQFGKLVADCVAILTDESGENRRERKEKTYRKMAGVSGDLELALIVKAADRLANMRACVAGDNADKLAMYKEEHEAFREAAYRPGLCDELWHEIDRIYTSAQHGGYSFRFWKGDHGLIRQRSRPGELHHPEIVRGKKWVTGSPYVMDAITGMGEDPWSCGEWAWEISAEEAEEMAREREVGLFDG